MHLKVFSVLPDHCLLGYYTKLEHVLMITVGTPADDYQSEKMHADAVIGISVFYTCILLIIKPMPCL